MSQASLFQYYSVCKRKVDEPFKKDKEQQQPQLAASQASTLSTVDLQLPHSKLVQKLELSSSTVTITADRVPPYVGKDENTSNQSEEASPFKVPTTPVPRRTKSVTTPASNKRASVRKSGSKGSGVGSRTATPDRNQQSILKWAKRKQPEEMSAGSMSPLRLFDQLNESNTQSDVNSNSDSTYETPKRKKQQPETDDLILSDNKIVSPLAFKHPTTGRPSIRCALAEPMRAVQHEQEQQIEDLIKCNETSVESNSSKTVAQEKLELLGSGSNLAALRQRMRSSLTTVDSPRKVSHSTNLTENLGSSSSNAITPTKSAFESPSKDQLVRERKLAFGKCSNLAELREKLAGTDRSFLDKLKQFERNASSPVKLNLSALNPNSPTKRITDIGSPAARRALMLSTNASPKKLLEEIYSNSPIKTRPDSRASVSTDGLNLPLKYKQLIDAFCCLDSVVSMIYNRQETCTFDKIRAGVQKITKKNFDMRQLAQMLFVYPTSYDCKWERRLSVETNDSVEASESIGRCGPYVFVARPCVANVKMSPSVLKVRKTQFEEKLLEFSKKEHQKYLLSLDPPIEISPELLRKWHPSFKFIDVPEAELPKAPVVANSVRTDSIADFWNKSSLVKNEPVVEKAPEQAQKEACKEKITKGPLRGLSLGFLEKIKNKEAALLAKDMTRKPEDERKLSMIKQLPPLIRILHSYFVVEKRAAIPIELVIQKCTESSLALSVGSCNDYLYLLNELLPDWLFILKVSKGTFIKIDKNKVLDDLFQRLDRVVMRLKQT